MKLLAAASLILIFILLMTATGLQKTKTATIKKIITSKKSTTIFLKESSNKLIVFKRLDRLKAGDRIEYIARPLSEKNAFVAEKIYLIGRP